MLVRDEECSMASDGAADQTYDVIVIGGGSTGTNAAWYARDNGLSVAVVERELVGGECSYWACIPSKTLLGPPDLVAAARRVPGAAAAVTGEVDVQAVLRRRDEWTSDLDDEGEASWVESIGATLVRGRGRLVGERRVEVERDDGAVRTLTADRAVIVATGSRPNLPPIDGLDRTSVWTNREATQADRIPDRLLVLGGGAVGCELAQAYARLGAAVTVIEMTDRLLPPYEPEVGATLQAAFEEEGLTVLTATTATSVTRDGQDGPVTVTTEAGDDLVGDELLVAIGRTPNSDDLGLDTVGLEPGGPIEVDDRLAVQGIDGDWLYAAGDVNGRALLTHQGKYQARIVGDVVAGRDVEAWADHGVVPQVVFTDPQVASVGRTEEEARDAGLEVRIAESDPNRVAGGALHGHDHGYAKLVIDTHRRVVVGATFVGPGVGELLHAATVAIAGEVPLDTLWHAVPAFPTTSEVWLRLLEDDRGIS
jgi:pyruvate/2-oxoglutarate dehydrogenase complex dihydrolipoamide dehydrogenase (E3) component